MGSVSRHYYFLAFVGSWSLAMERRDLREFYLIALSGNSTSLPRPLNTTKSEKPQIENHDEHEHSDPQQDPQGYAALEDGNDDTNVQDGRLGSLICGKQDTDLPPRHEVSPLGGQYSPNNDQRHAVPAEENIDPESGLGTTGSKAPQLRSLIRDELSILRNLQLAWKDSA
jgi:hypothetical protein